MPSFDRILSQSKLLWILHEISGISHSLNAQDLQSERERERETERERELAIGHAVLSSQTYSRTTPTARALPPVSGCSKFVEIEGRYGEA